MASSYLLEVLPNIDRTLFNSSTTKALMAFDDDGHMKPSAYYDRIVYVMEELVKFTYLTRDKVDWLTDRYS